MSSVPGMADKGTYHHSAAGHHKHGHAHHVAAVANLETATAAVASDLDGMKVLPTRRPLAPFLAHIGHPHVVFGFHILCEHFLFDPMRSSSTVRIF